MVFLPFLRGEVIKAGADFDKLCEPFYHIHRMPPTSVISDRGLFLLFANA